MKMKVSILLCLFFLFVAMRAVCGGAGQSSQTVSGGGPEKVTLTGFSVYSPPPVQGVNNYNDHIAWKVINEKYGFQIQWQNVPDTSEWQTQLGLIMASGTLPDFFIRITPQLAEQYGRQGALLPLGELINTKVPHLKTVMNDNKPVAGQITSEDGKIYFFPRLLLDPRLRHYPGLMIREDWVETLGLQMPQTIDDFYKVLKAFKEADFNKDGNKNEAPFMGDYKFLIWAFGVGSRGFNQSNDFFIEGGRIKYGPADPRYRSALEYLNKLYTEGLIELSPNNDTLMQKVISESVGSTYGSWTGALTTYNKLLATEKKTPGLRGVIPLQGPSGERNVLSNHTELDLSCGGAIASTTKKADDAARLFDLLYSREGQLLIHYGIEGDTYTMVKGVPAYTDKVTKHPSLSMVNYINAYIGNRSVIPTLYMVESYLSSLDPEGLVANEITATNGGNKKPPSLRFNDAEMAEVQVLQRDINTYVDENRDKFINGQQSFSQWDTFQAGLWRLNVSRLIEIYDTAYQRYLKVVSQ
jgi:putative aldouronate transport system substrate-binding protein